MSMGVAEKAHLFRKAVDDLMKVLENPNTRLEDNEEDVRG